MGELTKKEYAGLGESWNPTPAICNEAFGSAPHFCQGGVGGAKGELNTRNHLAFALYLHRQMPAKRNSIEPRVS